MSFAGDCSTHVDHIESHLDVHDRSQFVPLSFPSIRKQNEEIQNEIHSREKVKFDLLIIQ